MDMYICAPWGDYELEVVTKSTNGGNAMEKISWEVEYGPDEVCTFADGDCHRPPFRHSTEL